MLESRARWSFATEEDPNIGNKTSILSKLLSQRNLHSEEEIDLFLNPSIDQLQSPKDLAMIDQAKQRIDQAIEKKEKILIYGDYDADGVSSTALLMKAFKELGGKSDYYIPNRFREGYGLNKDAIHYAKEENVKLIITVDNGIAAFEEVSLAKELGIDIIITDHHDIQGEVPDAYAIIHTHLSPDYEFKALAGVGLAFKLAEYLLGYFPKHLLDLVALGTVADLVPLLGENRILTHFGLKELTNTNNLGLSALKRSCGLKDYITEEDLGFRLGPRINAVGRLADAELAVQLLISDDLHEIEEIVEEIEGLNRKRQELVLEILKEAEAELRDLGEREVIFLAKEGWHEGVLGIVASRLAQKYFRPSFILSLNSETNSLKGSARSIPDFHLFDTCMEVRDLFISFGGHSQAAGLTISSENKDALIKHLNGKLEDLPAESLQESIQISQSLGLEDISKELIHEIHKLAPFGMDNPKPLFHLKERPLEVNRIGRDKSHLKLQYMKGHERIEGIGFNIGHLGDEIAPQSKVSIVGELGINEWNGFETVQIIIEDLKIDEWQLFDYRGKTNMDEQSILRMAKGALFVSEEPNIYNNISEVLTYPNALKQGKDIKSLVLLGLPKRKEDLKELIKELKPERIFLHFQLKNPIYLQSFPSRDDFKWLYAFIHKKESFDAKLKIPKIMKFKKWTKDQVIFMLHVFSDLNFIQSEAGQISLTNNPDKRPLDDSKVYQERKERLELERTLYYSKYNQLKHLFAGWYGELTEEETDNGL